MENDTCFKVKISFKKYVELNFCLALLEIGHDKGKRMLGEGPKIKTGKQDCYFDKEFKRLFTGEAIKGKRKPYVATNQYTTHVFE